MRHNSNISNFVNEPPVRPVDTGLILQEINASEVRSLVPLILFYSVILIIGVIGNALVLLVYTFRYKRSPARIFILFLASIDFSICMFGLPYHLIDLTHPYTFTNKITCKLLTFVITTLFHMSVFGLIVIAIDRYLKICMPLSHLQMSFFKKRRACIGAAVAAVLFSWPNIILYGQSEMETSVENVTGYACYYETQYLDTNYPLLYTVTTLFVCVFCTFFLIIAYSLIYVQIYRRYYGIKRTNSLKLTTDVTCTEDVLRKSVGKNCHTLAIPDIIPKQTSTLVKSDKLKNPYVVEKNYEKQNESIMNSASKYKSGLDEPVLGDNMFAKKALEENIKGNSSAVGKLADHNGSHDVVYQTVLDSSDLMENMQVRNTEETVYDCSKKKLEQLNLQNISKSKCENTCERRDIVDNGAVCANGSASTVNSAISAHSLSKIISSLDSAQSTGAINVASSRGGFPMCRPQKLKRRSLDSFSSKAFLRNSHQRSVSLAHIPARNLNIVNECEGLRIHTGSSASMFTSVSNSNQCRENHSKITKIMLTITVIFILSYSPALIVTIISVLKPDIWDIMTMQETIMCEFFLRLYLVNNVCNPFIYGFWDKRFLREIRYSFKKLIQRIKELCCCRKK